LDLKNLTNNLELMEDKELLNFKNYIKFGIFNERIKDYFKNSIGFKKLKSTYEKFQT